MDQITTFVDRCDAVAERLRLKRSTVSTAIFNDGKRLSDLAADRGDIGVKRLARAEAALHKLERERA